MCQWRDDARRIKPAKMAALRPPFGKAKVTEEPEMVVLDFDLVPEEEFDAL